MTRSSFQVPAVRMLSNSSLSTSLNLAVAYEACHLTPWKYLEGGGRMKAILSVSTASLDATFEPTSPDYLYQPIAHLQAKVQYTRG